MNADRESKTSVTRTVLVLGEPDRAEMQPLICWVLDQFKADCKLLTARDTQEFTPEIVTDNFPDLIIVLESWPDQFSVRDVGNLFALAPLARVVVCYGAWCESDGRNRQIWPQAVCVPVWAAKSRIDQEWRLIQSPGERQPLPWSASREEVFAADHPPITPGTDPQMVLIDSPDPNYRRYLVERLAAEGYLSVEENPTIVLFDVDPWSPSRAATLRTLSQQHPQAVVVAVASLIQPNLEHEAHQLGVRRILPKLGDWESMLGSVSFVR